MKPLVESMDECLKGKYGYEYTSGKMCWKKQYLPWYQIDNTPDIGLAIWDVFAHEVDGLVEAVSFKFHHSKYTKMADLLKAKYGQPTQEKVATAQNKMGATFESLEMAWVGKMFTLTFESRANKIDEGNVRIYSKKYIESLKFNTGKYKDNL